MSEGCRIAFAAVGGCLDRARCRTCEREAAAGMLSEVAGPGGALTLATEALGELALVAAVAGRKVRGVGGTG